MAKKSKSRTKVEETEIVIELPSVPNFPYQPRDVTPPKGVVLILATENGYVLGDWCGHYYMDEQHRKIEPVYGPVFYWCVLLGADGKVIMVDGE